VTAALAALLAAAACQRDLLRDDAQPAGPSLVQPSARYAAMGYMDLSAMNESGRVVGGDGWYGYFWRRGIERRELYTSPSDRSAASDINNAGTVVGTLRQQGVSRLMLWSEAGGMVVVPLPQGWRSAEGFAINEAGVVAGRATLADSSLRVFRWSAAAGMQLLPRVYQGSEIPTSPSQYREYVTEINEAGDILGSFTHFCMAGGPVPCHGYYWRGAVVWTASGEQRVLAGESGLAVTVTDLSESGVVVGCDHDTPTLWTAAGARQALGAPGQTGCAAAVNEAGVVVGELDDLAFRWTAAEGMEVLGTLGGAFSRATDVNEAGDVTGGTSQSAGRPYTAFLWTPEGRMQALLPLPDRSWSEGEFINEAREVAGSSDGWGTFWDDVVVNRPPVAHAGGPYPGRITGRRYTYSAAATEDADGTRLRYSWDMDGDGDFDAVTNAALLGYAYPAAGSYTIRLVVLDDGGHTDTTTTTAQVVQNVAPVIASLTGMPTSRGEGLPITLTPTVRDANQAVDSTELSLVRYRWDWGDGSTSATRTGTHAYADQGTYTVRLVVTDAGGMADTVVRTAVIGNVAPRVTAQATSPTTFAAGGSLSLSAAFTDVAGDGPWRYRIYWGDGAYTVLTNVAAGATITGSHAYARPGSYQPYVAVVDKDGGSGRSASIAVTVTP
jgi:probable HAF family extracellular repeat protein